MNPATLAEWLRRRGHRIVEGAGSLWYDAGARIFQPIPFHQTLTLDTSEIRALMRHAGALGVRYSTPSTADVGLASYHVVFDQGPYGIEACGPRTRNKIRRGLRACRVEPISLEQLAHDGWRLQQDTLARQGRSASMDQATWVRLCKAADGLPGFESWGAFVEGQLAASLLLARVDDTFAIVTAQSDRAYFVQYANNALCYTVSVDIMGRPGTRLIFYSTHSLDAPPSVDEFKFLMGYRAKPVRQRIVLHPLAAPLCNGATHRLVQAMLRTSGGHPTLAKAEGLIRFYREGRRPAERQQLPAVLKQELFDEQASV